MNVFFGAAIQGVQNRGERAEVYRGLIDAIKQQGHYVLTEHSAAKDYHSTLVSLESTFGPLPKDDVSRRIFVRNQMIACVEGDIGAAVFEVSTPSLGTGIEIAHAYLRPRLGLKSVPILALYQTGYWPHHLSSMIRGLSKETAPTFQLMDYRDAQEASLLVKEFLL